MAPATAEGQQLFRPLRYSRRPFELRSCSEGQQLFRPLRYSRRPFELRSCSEGQQLFRPLRRQLFRDRDRGDGTIVRKGLAAQHTLTVGAADNRLQFDLSRLRLSVCPDRRAAVRA